MLKYVFESHCITQKTFRIAIYIVLCIRRQIYDRNIDNAINTVADRAVSILFDVKSGGKVKPW